MAEMIPALAPHKTPYSERSIFERLKKDPATKEWIILHSLGLSSTRVGPHGEVDFVILVPGAGVLCLEVKGGGISCSGGQWKQENLQTGKITQLNKSPYLQARENMFSLMRHVVAHFGNKHPVSQATFSYAVAFPATKSPPHTPETEAWETFDIESLRRPISILVLMNLEQMRKKLARGVPVESVSSRTLGSLRKFLRPDFERVVMRAATISQSEEQLMSLTDEQYDYLDVAARNSRAIITGAAGTGKTVLALKHASDEAESGRRVLLLCFNRMLANWLAGEVNGSGEERITVSTYHRLLNNIIDDSPLREEYEQACHGQEASSIFGEIGPVYAELAISLVEIAFDTIVIDEGQDLINDSNLPVFNVLVNGGLAGGRWAVFGDFNRQAIYESPSKTGGEEVCLDMLRTYCREFSVVPLRKNCRNTRPIGEETALLSGFDSLPYRLGRAEGLAVDYRYWRRPGDHAEQLGRVIRKLIDEDISLSDVVILGPTRLENSAIQAAVDDLPVSIVAMSEGARLDGSAIPYSTIHAFKGMESPVVILIGIEDFDSDYQRALLYVGMSRARSHLIVLLRESTKGRMGELIEKKLRESWQG